MKRIAIDPQLCVKSGQCYYLHPGLVRRGDDNAPVVVPVELESAQLDEALALRDVCPMGAIEVVGEEPP